LLVIDESGAQVEGFQIHLGGTLTGGDAEGSGFGRKVRGLKTTAAELPDYVERVLRRYDKDREVGETFAQWTLRATDEELS
jgi:sulfite reductase (ferredoxin)